ncbi:MAG: very short patch repair endonuclease, partial [Deltaproteobacteria bacterium]|nr:very short patch repair endonuclease [Deltaproteobacteria bacterium]
MDHLNRLQRRTNISLIKVRDAAPVKIARRILSKNGFRYRLHSTAAEGKSDIILA